MRPRPMRAEYLQHMRVHVDEGGQLNHQNGIDLMAEVERLNAILNTPIVEPFIEAAASEARHQIYRWGDEQDAKKTAWEWFWLIGYLGGKAAHSVLSGDWKKAKHHTVTTAAALVNWHRHICNAEHLADVD